MLRTVSISLLAAFAVMLVIPAQAIDLNPFSLIKSAVEAAAEDRSSGDIAISPPILRSRLQSPPPSLMN